MTIFEILKDIITFKSGTLHKKPEFKDTFDKFVIMRFLSMHSTSFLTIDRLNVYAKQREISDEDFYLILVDQVPYDKNNFIQYIKKPKPPKEEES